MLRLMEITGLTLKDMSELTATFLLFVVLGVCMGNILSWEFKGLYKLLNNLMDALFSFIKKYISDRWKRRR